MNRGKFFISRILQSVTGIVELQTDEGIWLAIYPTSSMDMSYLQSKNISHQLIKDEIAKLSEGQVFVDVGANIGYFAFLASLKVGMSGSVYAIEPSVREFVRMLNVKALNNAQNVIMSNCALAEENTWYSFTISKYHTGLNRISADLSDQENQRVLVLRADHILNMPRVHLVKIDVEGAELKVLRGFERLLKERIVLKFIIEITDEFLHKYGDSKEELYDFMKLYGYYPTIISSDWQYDEIFIVNE